jgi:hypothetical protein
VWDDRVSQHCSSTMVGLPHMKALSSSSSFARLVGQGKSLEPMSHEL